ncbi:hypothetical protein LRS71_09565 [Rhodococcus pyridinivorans]|uniref:hypothetical protein n=1 Tax=Rhodococcus pyridinivorans TaxID=103816 RepID=UPI001E5F4C13|nr:hypothetical protein [Rhodococcus pyridinivorans]MCD5419801.1 hypothetical protein [Rhodococcus pyridinivorans]
MTLEGATPFLAGAQHLVRLAIVLVKHGFRVREVYLADRFLTPFEDGEHDHLKTQLRAAIKDGDLGVAMHLVRTADVVIDSIRLDRKGEPGSVRIRQAGVIQADDGPTAELNLSIQEAFGAR